MADGVKIDVPGAGSDDAGTPGVDSDATAAKTEPARAAPVKTAPAPDVSASKVVKTAPSKVVTTPRAAPTKVVTAPRTAPSKVTTPKVVTPTTPKVVTPTPPAVVTQTRPPAVPDMPAIPAMPESSVEGLERYAAPLTYARLSGTADKRCLPADLEAPSQKGELSEDQIGCLEASLRKAEGLDREQVSLVLVGDAWAKGDHKVWEPKVLRHLTDVDPSNPLFAYRLAFYLYETGDAERYEDVINWADVALAHRAAWTGDTYTKRVDGLYKLRAAVSQGLWKAAEAALREDNTEETRAAVRSTRSRTRDHAIEWLEFARVTGTSSTTADRLCRIAALNPSDCDEQS